MDHERLKAAWIAFVREGKVIDGEIRPAILESWQRCQQLGLSPYQKAANRVLSTQELQERRAANHELINTAMPMLQNLYQFMAGSGFIVTLADREGILLEVIGDAGVVEQVKRGNFSCGADWSEAGAGTNGVGTVLYLGQPLQVYSYEHFCICSHKWTCSGAPVRDPEGRVIGAIDMTGPYEKVNPHTLGMVVAAANAIGSQLSIQRAWQACEVANGYKTTILDSINEGMLAVDDQGRITMINEIAMQVLGVAGHLEGRLLAEVVGERNQALLEIAQGSRYPTDREITIYHPDGFRGQESIRCTVTARPVAGNLGGTVIAFNELRRARQLVQRMTGARAQFCFKDLVGKNKEFLKTLELAREVAQGNSNILLLGESGTGKDMFAQAIHTESPRRKGPFVAINCGAIPRDLLSSELFGYAEGAFTGARRGGNPGKFELADGGTIFLDEIGEMPLELQVLLLRVLEEKKVVRIGGQEVIPVDVRVIAATNRDLLPECERGNFRADLYYRLNVVAIQLIPLRQRLDDLEMLAWHFIRKLSRQLGKPMEAVDPVVWERWRAYHWPGNVRELQNVIERAVNLAKGPVLTVDLLPENLGRAENAWPGRLSQEEEKEILHRLMRKHHGNITRVAGEMGVARSTVYRKLYKYRLDSLA